MTTKFFNKHYENLDELKKDYKKLCFKMHPDLGGDHFSFVAMQNEYELVFNHIATPESDKPAEIMGALDDLSFLFNHDGLEILITGRWIWLDFAIKPSLEVIEQIKNIGYFWSKSKKMWYFDCTGKAKKRKKVAAKPWHDIVLTYGLDKIQNKKQLA